MEQRYVPQVHEDEAEAAESQEVAEEVEVAEVKAPAPKRRRRAVSTGVITPEQGQLMPV